MAEKIYTMFGGRSMAFEHEALETLTHYVESNYGRGSSKARKVEDEIAEHFIKSKLDLVTVKQANFALSQINFEETKTKDQEQEVSTAKVVDTTKTTGNLPNTPDDFARSFATEEKIFLGVAVYIAEQFKTKVMYVRIFFIIIGMFNGLGLFLYFFVYSVYVRNK